MIELIHDPFSLRRNDKIIFVNSPITRKETYETIDMSLREKGEENFTLRFIIDSPYWRQFKSAYKELPHVSLKEITPSSVLFERVKRKVPVWLTDQLIHDLNLNTNERIMSMNESWSKWIVESFFLEFNCNNYEDWVRSAYNCKTFKNPLPLEILDLLLDKIKLLLKDALTNNIEVDRIIKTLKAFPTMHQRLETLLLSPAIRPLLDQRPITNITFDRLLAETLPLIFPLPIKLHKRVSRLFCNELKNQRIKGSSLSATVQLLNAEWDNISEELVIWLKSNPTSLSKKAASHLSKIPIKTDCSDLHVLAKLFSPAESPNNIWMGIPSLQTWTREYTNYLRSVFCRRQLPELWDLDPAKKFTDWMQSESVTLYNDLENSFVKVSSSVRDALSQEQTVVLCVFDAFAYHLEDLLTKHFSEELAQQPTSHESIFAPVPTITEVAKKSVATGFPPNQCPRSWESALCQAYSLKPDQILLAMEWKDIDRIQLKKKHRLILYLDNRIDDALKNQRSYFALREEVDGFTADMAKRIRHWVEDLEHLQRKKPTIFVTADHGFTFAPPPNKEGETIKTVGHHRCVPVNNSSTLKVPDHLAFLNKEDYHLPISYLAATKRCATQKTISGFVMQHGGLLPEEVLIPLIRWFGTEQPIQFAKVFFPKKAEQIDSKWSLLLLIKNESGVNINQLKFSICLPNQKIETLLISKLHAGEERSSEILLDCDFISSDEEELTIQICQTIAGYDAPIQFEKVAVYHPLIIPDKDFDNMF